MYTGSTQGGAYNTTYGRSPPRDETIPPQRHPPAIPAERGQTNEGEKAEHDSSRPKAASIVTAEAAEGRT